MASAAPTVLLTYEDIEFIPQEREGDRHELFDGELVVTPSPIPDHQAISGKTYSAIRGIVLPNRLGRVYMAPIDVKFAPNVVAVPDIVFVRRERLGIVGRKAIEGAPDLIVEILSPSTRSRDLRRKKAVYARFGVAEYWIIDLMFREFFGFVLRDGEYEPLPEEDGGVRSTVIPDLVLDTETLFADA